MRAKLQFHPSLDTPEVRVWAAAVEEILNRRLQQAMVELDVFGTFSLPVAAPRRIAEPDAATQGVGRAPRQGEPGGRELMRHGGGGNW